MDIRVGDCLDVLWELEDDSVDAVVTDPPYGLSFMGQVWDKRVPGPEYWLRIRRVLKPGGHLLAFGGSRTYHVLAYAIEAGGFDIRDQLLWLFGSGFPKSRNIANDMASDDAANWTGWGTALKPACEPIVLARKPITGTVAENVLKFGTGALNIDACRVPSEPMPPNRGAGGMPRRNPDERRGTGAVSQPHPLGRWPANVIHDGSDQVIAAFPDAGGQQGALTGNEPSGKMGAANCYGRMDRRHEARPRIEADTSAARFFYCAKASRKDRNEGCQAFDEKPLNWSSGETNPGSFQSEGTHKAARNNHPTVKPTELMRYLCRLVTPPGGIVLDPFCGSGSTGKACRAEGFDFIGIEIDPEYAEIAKARVLSISQSGLAL